MEINQKQSQKGSYSLLIELSDSLELDVGALGIIEFPSGFYVYNGSAFGSGGLKRIVRHKEKSESKGDAYWHVDYLLRLDTSKVVNVFELEGSDHECGLSSEMSENFGSVSDFGCSDCGCESHLFYSEDKGELVEFLSNFYES